LIRFTHLACESRSAVSDRTGQDLGHAGVAWADLLAALVETHGTLTAVAWKLVELAPGDDVASIERALRRLRTRGQRDGGVWGQRVLRVFGIPLTIEDRVRWMAFYHSPFTDLPVALCLDQLRLWDRPPVSSSRARIWLHLGFATCSLRGRELADARVHVQRATEALAPLGPDAPHYDAARIETALIAAFVASHDAGDVDAHFEHARQLLARATLSAADRACFAARLIDQRAYQLNRAGDHAAALALYESLPREDVHPFASYRRDAGLAYGYARTGRMADSLTLAHRACEHAGDGGYTRLRAMGLLLLAKLHGDIAARERARAIAVRLGDSALLDRVDR
jgi:hypothetical protein